MKNPLRRHVVVYDLGDRELEQRKEDSLGGVAQVVILHWRPPHDSGRIYRIAPHRQRRHVHLRVEIRLRVKSGVVAKRPFHHQVLGGVDVTLDHELGVGGNLQLAGHRLRQVHRGVSQKPGKQELVDRWRQRRGR